RRPAAPPAPQRARAALEPLYMRPSGLELAIKGCGAVAPAGIAETQPDRQREIERQDYLPHGHHAPPRRSVDVVIRERGDLAFLVELVHLSLNGSARFSPDCPDVALPVDEELSVRSGRDHAVGIDDVCTIG